MTEIGAFEAKTQLSKILAQVRKGEVYIITLRGEPIAQITPIGQKTNLGIRERIEAFRKKRLNKTIKPLTMEEIIKYKNEGRR